MKIEYLVLKDSTVKQYKIAINVNLVLFYYLKKITTNNWNLGRFVSKYNKSDVQYSPTL